MLGDKMIIRRKVAQQRSNERKEESGETSGEEFHPAIPGPDDFIVQYCKKKYGKIIMREPVADES